MVQNMKLTFSTYKNNGTSSVLDKYHDICVEFKDVYTEESRSGAMT